MAAENCQQNYLMKILSNFELPLWLNCNYMDIKVAISIKCWSNTIVWA